MTASLAQGGPFRGLVPFQESDQQQFFGRDTERARLQQWLRHEKPAAALVTGELASGKTSLLQAALIPLAKAARMMPLYVDVGEEWEAVLRASLARQLGRQLGPTDETASACLRLSQERQTPTLLIFDHLEQLVWFDETALAAFNRLLGGLSNEMGKNVRFVFGLERGDLHVLSRIAEPERRIPEQSRLHIGRLDQRQSAHLIERTILVGGAYMEAGLPDLIAEELCASGPVLPAQVQIVCHATVLARRLTISAYKRVGGASVLSALYVEQLAARAGGWRAKRVLAMLAEPDNPRTEFSVDQIAGGCGLPTPMAEGVVESLVSTGLARRVTQQAAAANRYGILHPYLLLQIRDLIAPLRRGRARARRALRRRAGRPGLLKPPDLFAIWRYLGSSLSPAEEAVVKRSWRTWGLAAGLVLALMLVTCLGIWGRLASSSYLAAAEGVPAPQRLVLRRGDPSLRFAFGWGLRPYGNVALDTGFAVSSLPAALVRSVEQGRIKGDLVERQHGIPRWLSEVLLPLAPARRGALLVLAGRRRSGSSLLAEAANQPAERERAVRSLVLLTGDSPATRRALLACMDDQRGPVRRMAVREAARLGTEVALPVLARAVRDTNPQVRLAGLRALGSLPRALALPLVGTLVQDTDARVHQLAIEQVREAAEDHPLAVFDIALSVTAAAEGGIALARTLAIELQRLQQQVAQRAPIELAKHLIKRLPDESDPPRRAALLRALVPMADQVTDAVLPIVKAMLEDPDVDVRATATGLHARFAEPEQAMQQLSTLARIYRPRLEAAAMRQAAAQGLAWVRAPDDKERIDLLERLLADGARPVRDAAVASLIHLGARGLKEVVKRIKRGYVDTAEAALAVICSDPKPDRRIATTVLVAAWELKRVPLRRQALACAPSLDAASPWLSTWLADRAALAKDPLVRRAAARAVVLALAHSGSRLARLPRYYLRDRDPGVRIAVLRQVAEHPPQAAAFLLPMIERTATAAEPTVRAAAAAAVLAVAPSAVDGASLLERLIGDEDGDVRRAALESLGRLERPTKGKPSARWEEARQRLDRALAREISTLPLSTTRTALAVATHLELGATLRSAASHAHPQARAEAIERLAANAPPAVALKMLASARRDPALAPRLAAIKGLAAQSARLGRSIVPLLADGTEAEALSERWATFEALGDLKGEASAQSLDLLRDAARDRSERRRQMAMRALGRLSEHVAAAAMVLIEGTLDPAHDVRVEATTALAKYMGRTCSPDALWELLIDGERNALLRHLATAALAWHGRLHGVAWLKGRVQGLDRSLPVVIEIAARLALALAGDDRVPQATLDWLLG